MNFLDKLFGGSDKSAHRYTKQRNAELDAYIQQMMDQSRGDMMGLWPGAMDNANMGYQAALDMFGQSVPQQMGAFTQGNMNAQSTLLGGLDPYMAALMGNPVDMSGLQPRGVNYDTSWIPQNLPEYASAANLLGGAPQQPSQGGNPGQAGGQAGNFGETFRRIYGMEP